MRGFNEFKTRFPEHIAKELNMASLNQVQIIGNLGADPEVKSFSNGNRIANLRIATSESWKDRTTGERKERTEWHSVVLDNEGLAGVAEKYLRKGSRVYVEGELRTRKWQDREGNDRYTTEVRVGGFRGQIVLLDRLEGGGQPGGHQASRPARTAPDDDFYSDDVPF